MKTSITAIMTMIVTGLLASAWADGFKDPETGMEFVFVKGGCFQMQHGNRAEGHGDETGRQACVKDFYIGKYEVTQGQWKRIMGNNPSIFKDCGDNCPVESLSWDDAEEFIGLLNKRTGKSYRLPQEAEWEYAARSGGKEEKWAGTSDETELRDYAWYRENSGKRTHPVGQKKPNGLGIYDMSGNVAEWIEDKHFKTYPATATQSSGTWEFYVIRGGFWGDTAEALQFVTHNVGRAIETYLDIGFRIVVPAENGNESDKKEVLRAPTELNTSQ